MLHTYREIPGKLSALYSYFHVYIYDFVHIKSSFPFSLILKPSDSYLCFPCLKGKHIEPDF